MKHTLLQLTRTCLLVAVAQSATMAVAQTPTNPPPAPVITISAPDAYAAEPNDPGMFRLLRQGPTNETLSVALQIGGTATPGLDYAPLPNLVVIPAGHREVALPVLTADDVIPEPLESVQVRVLLPPPGAPFYVVGTPGDAVVTIRDDDGGFTNRPPRVELISPQDGSIFLAPVNVFLAAAAGDPDPGDLVTAVEFFDGTNFLGADLVPPFGLVLSNVPPGRHEVRALARDTQGATTLSQPIHFAVVTNLPPPPTNSFTLVSIQAVDAIAAEGTNSMRWTNYCNQPFTNFCGTNFAQFEGTNTARFIVRRHGPTNDALLVHYRVGGSASNGLDYAQLPGIVEIPAGRHTAPIVVQPIDDLVPEPLENVVIGLRPPPDWPTNTPPPYVIGLPARAAAVIVDNDGPRPPHCLFPDHTFHFVHPGTNGGWVRIECTTNMVHWLPISTNQVTDGALHFVDPDGDGRPSGYYRVVPCLPPPPED